MTRSAVISSVFVAALAAPADACSADLPPLAPGNGWTTRDAVSGDPSSSVIELAKRGAGDLVVVGNKGLGGWRRLLGSVPSRVLAAGRVPVVVVPTA